MRLPECVNRVLMTFLTVHVVLQGTLPAVAPSDYDEADHAPRGIGPMATDVDRLPWPANRSSDLENPAEIGVERTACYEEPSRDDLASYGAEILAKQDVPDASQEQNVTLAYLLGNPVGPDGATPERTSPIEQVRWDEGLQPVSSRQEQIAPGQVEYEPAPETATACGADACCPPCRLPTWAFGTEATFLAPQYSSGDVSYLVSDVAADASRHFAVDEVNALTVAPRIWLGVQGPCWGIVGRYWHLRDSDTGHEPFSISPSDGDYGFLTNSRFEAYTVDLELTRAFCVHATKMTAAIGARYAAMEQHNSVLGFAAVDDDVLTGTARTGRSSYGTGFTVAFSGRHPLFCNSCANVFFNLRNSVVWGRSWIGADTSSTVVEPDGSAQAYNGALADVSDHIYIGEVQLGIEWNYPLQCLPANALFRLAAEYQYWDAGEGEAYAQSFAEEVGVAEGTATAYAQGLRTDLIGFSLGAGFTW